MTTVDWIVGRLRLGSLFWRFLVIGIAALAPLVGALVQLAGEERRVVVEATQERAGLLAASVAESQRHAVEETKRTLRFLAAAREVQSGGEECQGLLARQAGLNRWIDELTLVDRNGRPVCGARREGLDATRADNRIFAPIRQGADFVLGELSVNERTGSPRLTAAVPVPGAAGAPSILSAEINPRIFEDLAPLRLSAGLDVNMLLLDRNGRLIAHFPPAESLIGENLADRPLVRTALERPKGGIETEDLNGMMRQYVFRHLPGTDAIVAIGINRDAVIAGIDATLRNRLILITVIIVGSVLLGMLGVESLILGPLRNLARTAEALERGDLDARSPTEGAAEVKTLARTLNRMADAVAEREHDLVAAKDLAERALREANAANKAKSDFLASMSHEIRTPLNGIIGYAERLLDESLTPKQRRHADLIQVSASALLTVANDILDFSVIEAEQITLRNEGFSVAGLVNDTVAIVSSGAGRKGVPIRISLDPSLPDTLVGDEARLRQVLLNLLNNAVKFTRQGHITTSVRYLGETDAGELIRISVSDTGIGIAPDKHDRLFKRFSQVDPSIRREFGGTGLGLAICKHLVELMGGSINVESEPGKGSTFWIQVALRRIEEAARPVRDTPRATNGNAARILLVDDLEMNQELVSIILTSNGYEVDIASNGKDAIAAVQERAYDLVLMDVQMPVMDGVTATRIIRSLDHAASRVRIVAMTANVLPQQIQSFSDAGIDGHIGKPIKQDELLRRINEWLEVNGGRSIERGGTTLLRGEFDGRAFGEFRKTIGDDRAHQWISRLREQIHRDFLGAEVDLSDRKLVASRAHALISQAALMGFLELAAHCTALEQACHQGIEIAPHLEKMRRSARLAYAKLASFMGPTEPTILSPSVVPNL